jgi:hypothetical protein
MFRQGLRDARPIPNGVSPSACRRTCSGPQIVVSDFAHNLVYALATVPGVVNQTPSI